MTWFLTRHYDADGGEGGGGDATPTIKVSHNGTEIEVPRPKGLLSQAEIDKTYIPKAAHNDQFARLRKQLDDVKGYRNPDELLDDADFRSRATEKWGMNPNQTAQQLQEQVSKAKTEITERQLKPLQKQLETAAGKVTKLLQDKLKGEIVAAAAEVGIDPTLLKAATKGGTPMIVSMLRDSFGFDEENDAWFAKGANGQFAYSTSGETPYQTASEFLANWAAGDGKGFVRSQRQQGTASEHQHDSKGTAPGQVGRELRLTHSQIRDLSFFKQQSEYAAKNGLTIVPVPDP